LASYPTKRQRALRAEENLMKRRLNLIGYAIGLPSMERARVEPQS
jgi:hypothetical protein